MRGVRPTLLPRWSSVSACVGACAVNSLVALKSSPCACCGCYHKHSSNLNMGLQARILLHVCQQVAGRRLHWSS